MTALSDWDDIARYRDEHCPKCKNRKAGTLTDRCKCVAGATVVFAIEHGRCHFEEA